MRAVRAWALPAMVPSASRMPARYISASASMIPEPQIPVTPVAAVASANPSSSDQRSQPMTLTLTSSVSRSMRTRSIAPGAARWPASICAPSKAGPVGDDAASSRSLLPSTISALVPTSTISSFIGPVRGFGQHHASRVGPHVAGDAGQHVDARAGVDIRCLLPARESLVRGFEGERRQLDDIARRGLRRIRSEPAISASASFPAVPPAAGATPLSSRRVAAGDQQIRDPSSNAMRCLFFATPR